MKYLNLHPECRLDARIIILPLIKLNYKIY